MNTIQKQKGWLMGLGIGLMVLSIILICCGVPLLVGGIHAVSDAANSSSAGGVVMIVFGALMCILFAPGLILGIYYLWVGGYLSATKGSIKQGNIAKEGGTVNMVKCDKCGTEIKAGETVCSNCGKPVEAQKVQPESIKVEAKIEPEVQKVEAEQTMPKDDDKQGE